MTRNTFAKYSLSGTAQHALATLGANLQTARKRRGWRMEDLAGTMMVTRKTLARLESGDPSVGLAVLAAALHALGLLPELMRIGAPEKDTVGIFAEKQRLPKRVRIPKTQVDDLDF